VIEREVYKSPSAGVALAMYNLDDQSPISPRLVQPGPVERLFGLSIDQEYHPQDYDGGSRHLPGYLRQGIQAKFDEKKITTSIACRPNMVAAAMKVGRRLRLGLQEL